MKIIALRNNFWCDGYAKTM